MAPFHHMVNNHSPALLCTPTSRCLTSCDLEPAALRHSCVTSECWSSWKRQAWMQKPCHLIIYKLCCSLTELWHETTTCYQRHLIMVTILWHRLMKTVLYRMSCLMSNAETQGPEGCQQLQPYFKQQEVHGTGEAWVVPTMVTPSGRFMK